ncbi:MAG TPA: hypothetical protein VF877_10550 [Gaiellaceae bacterium]
MTRSAAKRSSSSIEVESALVDLKRVAEAAVCGRKDERTGAGVVAYVTLRDGDEGSLETTRGAPEPPREEDRPDRKAGEHRLHVRAAEDL